MSEVRASFKGADELLRAVRDVVSLVDRAIPDLVSGQDQMPRHFAALGLARCNRLLAGMVTLRDDELQDVAGALARPIVEVMLVSLYSLYGGHAAYDEVRGQYIAELAKFPGDDPLGQASRNLIARWTGPRQRIPVEQLAQRVGKLLEAEGDPAARQGAQMMYDVAYRGHSLMDSHGGVGPVVGHQIDHGDSLTVARVRRQIADGIGDLVVAAAHVLMLGHHVFKAFDIDRSPLQAPWETLVEGATSGNLVVEDDHLT